MPVIKEEKESVKIIPLGGVGQIGMNITAFEYKDSIIVVDCGLAFPDDEMLGIDLVIPDVTFLKDNIEKVKGFFITHAHEDHIGSIPYVFREINVPIYSTKLTCAIIENKLKEHDLQYAVELNVIEFGQTVSVDEFEVEFVKMNHSISDAACFAIHTSIGTIIHTGDFKVDYTPVFGDVADLQRLGELGKKGVLALLADSTNAERPGFAMSERTVGRTFENIFIENVNKRLIIATFASNVDRVQQIIDKAAKFGRKVVIEGRSMITIMNTATELGYISVPENIIIDIDQMKNYPPEKLVLITTGSQGESMAALSRMAGDTHKKVKIDENDTVVFSSSPIPGNEKNVFKIINELSLKKAKVIFQDTHVSGHACQDEIKLIYALTKPKYAIPVHGEYKHLIKHAEIASDMGISKENIFVLKPGNVLQISKNNAGFIGSVSAQGILVDGLGIGDVGNCVLRERQQLSENGLVISVSYVDREEHRPVMNSQIITKGFVYEPDEKDLLEELSGFVDMTIEDEVNGSSDDINHLQAVVKKELLTYIRKKMKRSPVVISIIQEG
ncbi:MAG: ribonuclease J [Lachnospiraceae bacterium]|nr:ribonuclease J [Lachnospiraceae bacterium]